MARGRGAGICMGVRTGSGARDPSAATGDRRFMSPNDHNSTFANVACELLGSPEFFTAVEAIFRTIVDAEWRESTGKVWVLYCTAGQHRSDGCGRCVGRMFNHWPIERRHFNCNIFSLKYVHKSSVMDTAVADAIRWANEPWCIRGESEPWGDLT